MNAIDRPIWDDKARAAIAVPESRKSACDDASFYDGASCHVRSFALNTLAGCLLLSCGVSAYALPQGGVVSAGSASVANGGSSTTITQTSQNAAINWQSFGIAAGQTVQFAQPNASSVALNRVLGPDPSNIFGNLSANGKVFLVNPNGVLFGSGASVNVGGLVASTLNMTDANLLAGKYIFSGPGSGSVVNEGTINADGGYVALLGASISNQGVISARLGSVALAAGNAMTLDMAGDKLLSVKVDQGAVNALAENGGLIQSDGGTVLMTARAAGNLLSGVVNNTGVVRAQTIINSNGTIKLGLNPAPAAEVSNLALLQVPAISFTGSSAPPPPPACVPTNPPPTVGTTNPPPTVVPTNPPPTVVPTNPPPTVGTTNPTPTVVPTNPTVVPASAAPVGLASYVVPTFSLPVIPQQVAGLPLVMTAFDSPAPVELVEVLPPQAPPVLEEQPALPVPYVAPVRRPKQDRH
jgi:filamentous hemagglutinin family protein